MDSRDWLMLAIGAAIGWLALPTVIGFVTGGLRKKM